MAGSVAERRDRAGVLTACVQAANVWCGRQRSAGDRWFEIARLHSGVALAHLSYGAGVFSLVNFVDGLAGPLAGLMPAALREDCDDVPLIDGDALSPAAFDLLRENLAPSVTPGSVAEWTWEQLSAEKIQGRLYQQLLETGTQRGYEDARSAVIRHASGPLVEINDLIKQVGLPRDGLYQPIPAWAWATGNGERYWFPCPVCRWPMRFQLDRLTCSYPPHAQAIGSPSVRWARSGPPRVGAWRQDKLPALGVDATTNIAAFPVDDYVALAAPVWRYSTIPGCDELYLHRRLTAMDGVTATLWPRTDAYDLLVEIDGRKRPWRVDVKDYTDPARLATVLASMESLRSTDMQIVIPNYRDRQLGVLNERLRTAFGQPRRRFAVTSKQFLAMVRREAAKHGGQS